MGHDLRTPCVGGAPTVVWEKTKPEAKRFAIHNSRAVLRDPSDVYSAEEIEQIRRFTARIGLDWGGLDILRDRHDGRIYIVDVNKTDLGPVIALSWPDKIRSMNRLSRALDAMVRAEAPATAVSPDHLYTDDRRRNGLPRYAAPAILLAACALWMLYWSHQNPQADVLAMFRQYSAAWRAYDAAHPFIAFAAYVSAYAGAIVAMLPIALIMTFCGGAIFGAKAGAAGSVAGAVLGALIAYVIAAMSAADDRNAPRTLQGSYARWVDSLTRNPFRFTLALRLMPLTPFTLVSMAAGLARIKLTSFLLGTICGVLPECVIYSAIGAGLSEQLSQGSAVNLSSFMHPTLLLSLAGLAIVTVTGVRFGRGRQEQPPLPSPSMASRPVTR